MIIPALYAKQELRGYLTSDDLRAVAEELAEPLHRVQSVVSFFPHFRTLPPPKIEVQICRDMACHLNGSVQTLEKIQSRCSERWGDEARVCGVSCLGRCDRAPVSTINERLYLKRTTEELFELLEAYDRGELPDCDTDQEALDRKGTHWEIDVYGGRGSYEAVREYLQAPQPEKVIEALERSGLLGMGGAGGRAYLKWLDVLRAPGSTKFVVCNADESEPGTFKDRDILLRAPYLTIEGMLIAGLVVGASQGWIYIRHEYPEQRRRLEKEIVRARHEGLLGSDILGTGRAFDVDIFVSPGGYICGEQTALVEAMENKRAEPRNRPPELMTNGYRNQPTLLNNVETLAWVPAILLRERGEWYARQGRKEGTWKAHGSEPPRGKRMFSVSGDVERPGVYEVPTGIPLGELIDEYCGGMLAGKQLAAAALSGPSGGLLPPRVPIRMLPRDFVARCVPPGATELDIRELPLDIQVSRAMGLMIGAGIVIYGEGADLLEAALACSRFFRNESCGKCVPCRLGSEKITQIGEDLFRGRYTTSELTQMKYSLTDLAQVMTATSICGLGQVASNPIRSMLTFFPGLVERACENGTSNSVEPPTRDRPHE